MSPTRTAGFVHVLPASLIPAGAARDDGDADAGADHDDENATGATGQGDSSSQGATGSSADDDASADAGAAGEDSGGADDVRDPELKKVHEEAKRWRLRCRELEAQIADGEVVRADVRDLQVEKEFYRHAAQRVRDLDAAFKLADRSLITTHDDGTITGVEDMVERVVQHYPFLSDDPEDLTERTTKVPDGPKEGGSPTNGARRTGKPKPSTSTLQKKFPALERKR